MKRNRTWTRGVFAVLAGSAWLLTGAGMSACAQNTTAAQNEQNTRNSRRQADSSTSNSTARTSDRLTIPAAEQLLQLEVSRPSEVRVGQSYQYEIRVKNVSQQIAVNDVKISQKLPDQFEIEKTGTAQQESQQKSEASPNARQKNRKDGNAQSAGKQSSREKSQKDKQQKQENSASAKDASSQGVRSETVDGQHVWTISSLKPGETRTIQVTASSDKEGEVDTCLAVTSYTPTLCLTTKFVKPELKIVKRAPEKATLCQPIEVEYFVQNDGTGDLKNFQVQDDLPEGLKTSDGKKTLKFTVDGLAAGDTRKFVARLRATRADDFSSRAVATLDGGETVRSQKTTTTVQEADLAVAIDGPDTHYVDRPMTLTVRVSNNGEVAAPGTRLHLEYPGSMSIANVGDLTESDRKVQSASSGSNVETRTAAFRGADADSGKKNADKASGRNSGKDSASDKETGEQEAWDIGTLEPGETRQVRVTVRPREGGQFTPRAVARFVCGEGTDNEVTQVAEATLNTEVLSLAALLIGVGDSEDPVAVDGETEYKIVVENEGTAADQNVELIVELPSQLKFIEASGETEATSEGQTVTFKPVKELKAGAKVTWSLRAKASAEGQAALKIRVKSESYNRGVTAEEPTRIFKSSNSGNKSSNSKN